MCGIAQHTSDYCIYTEFFVMLNFCVIKNCDIKVEEINFGGLIFIFCSSAYPCVICLCDSCLIENSSVGRCSVSTSNQPFAFKIELPWHVLCSSLTPCHSLYQRDCLRLVTIHNQSVISMQWHCSLGFPENSGYSMTDSVAKIVYSSDFIIVYQQN